MKLFYKFLNIFTNIFKKNNKNTGKKFNLNNLEQSYFIRKRKKIYINLNLYNKFKKIKNKIFFCILIIILIYMSFFKIQKIEVIRQDNIINMNIIYSSLNKYRWSHIFFYKKNDILKNIQNYQENIKDINIDIILPDKIEVLVSSYKQIFNTTINWKTFILTKNWALIPSIYSKELSEIFIVKYFNKNKFLDFKINIDSYYTDKISDIIKTIKQNIINIKINKITYYVIERELHIQVWKWNILIFDISKKYKDQIKKVIIFNKKYLNISNNKLLYTDLRIKNKVFYCDIENKYNCDKNLKKIYKKYTSK